MSASGQTVDSERERTYALAESLDGQLARMCGDLKEVDSGCPQIDLLIAAPWKTWKISMEQFSLIDISSSIRLSKVIEHLNSTARTQDSRDPVHQIGKVKIGNTFAQSL